MGKYAGQAVAQVGQWSNAGHKKAPPKKHAPQPSGKMPPNSPGVKKPKKRAPGPQEAHQPFDPLGTPYKTQGEFERAVRLRASRETLPEMNELASQGRIEGSRHTGRQQDIGQYFGYQDQQLGTALDKTNTELNQLIASRNASGADAQAGLLAALNTSRDADRGVSQTIGGPPAENTSSFGALSAALGAGQAGGTALTQTFGGLSSEAAGRLGVSTAQRGKATSDEAGRNRAILAELDQKRLALIRTIPGIEEDVRQQMMEEEVQKAAQRVQNKLAAQQLHETVRSNKAGEAQAATDSAISAAQGGSSGGSGTSGAEQNQAYWTTGQDLMSSYIGGLTGGTADKPTYTPPNPDQLFKILTQQGRLSRKQAANVMVSSTNGAIAKFGRTMKAHNQSPSGWKATKGRKSRPPRPQGKIHR